MSSVPAASPDLQIARFFAADGPLATAISGYRARASQTEMAEAVQAAIDSQGLLIAEAGTGTGKTFAYLVPALVSGGKVIISTGTKTLQDQLFQRDLPTVRTALNVPVTAALLKGRANYVCLHRLDLAEKEGRMISRDDVKHLHAISRFAKTTRSGDKASLSAVPENAMVWDQVTSTRENCLGQDCPSYDKCFVMLARKEALEADVVVVNHHLFFADVMLRDEGMAELLPACNTVIFDEAHQLPETARLFFGESVSTAQVIELCRDATAEALVNAPDFKDLPEGARLLEKAARDLRLTIPQDIARLSLSDVRDRDAFKEAVEILAGKLEGFNALLESQAARAEGLESCWQRGVELATIVERWRADDNLEYVRWVEVFNQNLHLHATPLAVGEIFRKQLEGHPRAWIFTSATLAVKNNFSHYQDEMGLEGLEKLSARAWGSPFDYENQALFYLPPGMPEPNSMEYTEAVIEAVMPLIEASGGRAFLLFTSLRAMQKAHRLVEEAFARKKLDYPLLLQGEGSRTELLDRFRKLGNAVLIGSQSFWEGVDVRGEALSLVMIDKLPFAPPDDPVLAARIQRMQSEGRNPFMEYQLPRAVINLKQGAGRLIRDETDRGVLMICDPRLVSKPYGRTIWQSLPPMRRTREESEAVAFFAGMKAEAA